MSLKPPMSYYWTAYGQFLYWATIASNEDSKTFPIDFSTLPSPHLVHMSASDELLNFDGPPRTMQLFWALAFLQKAKGNRLSVPRNSDRFYAVQSAEEYLAEALPDYRLMDYDQLWELMDNLEHDIREINSPKEKLWTILNDSMTVLWEVVFCLLILQWMLI